MSQFEVVKYNSDYFSAWNEFISRSKNATFLFHRDFMEYHKDRFEDYSLLVFEKKKLVALFPANRVGADLFSHRGLTYGGLLLPSEIKLEKTLHIFKSLLEFIASEGFEKIQLKLMPKIYHAIPSDEMDYLLFLTEAKLVKREVSAAIGIFSKLKIQKNRIEGVKKAENAGLVIKEEKNFNRFWNEILIPNLADKHRANPVHSSEEIRLLAEIFPMNIRQFNVFKNEKIVAGATIFESENVAHVQYISGNEEKQTLGSLDFLFEHLINEVFQNKKYFDFGTSNEEAGKKLNSGLMFWKECYGARSISQDTYEINPKLCINLQNVLL
ncbi:MAG TPA: GNAT family N-acetyltransferase [Salinimicrobium sp.]|nr:GNAT family N-acetyltransferase [Salinimicrobium sp.]